MKRQEGEQARIAKNLDDDRAERQGQIQDTPVRAADNAKSLALVAAARDSLKDEVRRLRELLEGALKRNYPFRENRGGASAILRASLEPGPDVAAILRGCKQD